MMPQEAPDTSPKNSPAKILLVDDDEVLLAHIGRTLQNQGYLVESCEDAHQALLKIKGGGFDLMITDFAMPRMTGVQLAHKAREARPSLPILLATGYAELPTGSDLPRLSKPYHQAQLGEEITKLMAGRTG